METLALLRPLAIALALGLLVGLQRGWQARAEPAGSRVAGFRTFGLLGLAGGLSALLPIAYGAILLGAAALTLVIGYLRESAPSDLSATGTIAGLLTLALGAFAAAGHPIEALAAAAIMVLLLSMRQQLHGFLHGITPAEIEAASRFAIIALVILPLMPDRAMGPLEAWNPRQLWLVVVLVLGLNFAGYVAARRLGPEKGLLVTAGAGALVSSTAVTASYARRLKEPSAAEGALVAGIAVASAIMYVRVLVLTGLLASRALPTLAATMLPAAAVAILMAWISVRRAPAQRHAGDLAIGNPLEFRAAFALAAFVAILAILSHYVLQRFGGAGVGTLLLLTGFADVDAAVITLAGLPPDALTPHQAGLLLALPIAANMLLKAGLAVVIAPNRRGLRAALPLALSVAAAAAGAAPLLLRP